MPASPPPPSGAPTTSRPTAGVRTSGVEPAWPAFGLDIETDTSAGGLDPATAAIVAIAMCSADGHLQFVFDGEESQMLREVDDLVAGLPPGLLITWNGAAFDLPFIESRAQRLGVPLGLRTSPDPLRVSRRDPTRVSVRARWHELVHLDGYLIYRSDVGRCLGLSCGLKSLAHLVGLSPVELDREQLHTADPTSLRRYVSSDARCAAALVERRMPLALLAADFPPPPIARTATAAREAEGRNAGPRSRAASTGSNPRPA